MYETTLIRGDVGDPLRNIIVSLLKEYKLQTFMLGRHIGLKINFINCQRDSMLSNKGVREWNDQLDNGIPVHEYLNDTMKISKIGFHTTVVRPSYIEIFFGKLASYDVINSEIVVAPIETDKVEYVQVARIFIEYEGGS